ncbi:MAG: catabolite repressor/activator [Lonepinella koalarum]|nr:catabolite repressor/activator [Lonepinella koalarum]
MKLDELAKLAGVSRTTVSYVINGKAKDYRVSDKTIAKVEALIEQYQFKPNAMAASLRVGKTNTIGLIIPDFQNQSYAKIANGLEAKFRAENYQVLMACSHDETDNEQDCVSHLQHRQVDALIVTSAMQQTDFYHKMKLPIIGLDREIQGKNNILCDDENDAYQLASTLLKGKNPSSVLFLGAKSELSVSQNREKGFRRALQENHITVDFVYVSHFSQQETNKVFKQWLEKNSLPDCIFVTSLTLLQGFLKAVWQKWQKIPPHLAIATFGEHDMLDFLSNPIVCSVQRYDEIVEKMFNLVMQKFNVKGKKEVLPNIIIPREIVIKNKI